mmetsp:Transcript_16438/g.32132  ORF Transcript_16438/g.32132 Transcript_16438/m.32132 type:complete len:401 (+) Transcript_16438:1-1203(+)
MFSFLKRHKTKLKVGALVATATGGYYLYRRFKPMIDEIQTQIKMIKQMEESKQESDKQMVEKQLDHNLRVGHVTTRTFSKKLKKHLAGRFDLEGLRASMSKSKDKKRTEDDHKQWQTFKLWGFSRSFAAVYSVCLLNMLVTIQLTIMSRYVMEDSEQPSAVKSAQERVNTTFLGLSTFFKEQGVALLCEDVLNAITAVLADWPLNKECTLEDIEGAFADVAASLGQHTDANIHRYLWPPGEDVAALLGQVEPSPAAKAEHVMVDQDFKSGGPLHKQDSDVVTGKDRLAAMIEETRVILHSASMQQLSSAVLSAGVDVLLESIKASYAAVAQSKSTVPLANVMVWSTKLFGSLLPEDSTQAADSPLFDKLADLGSTRDFCSVIFLPLEQTLQKLESQPPRT